MQFTLESDGHTYNFHHFGTGEYPVLFFHGVGQTGAAFSELMNALPECSFYCPDLPYHGETKYKQKIWKAEDLENMCRALCRELQIQHIGIAGFSIGGKVALKLIEILPAEMISGLYLFAPDGFKTSIYYQLATRNVIGKRLFTYLLSRPNLILRSAFILNKIKLLPAEVYKLLIHTMSHQQYIHCVKMIWTATAYFTPDTSTILSKINTYSIPTYIFIGKKDSVIPSRKIKYFHSKIITGHSGLYEMDIGHNFAQPKAVLLLKSWIKNNIISQCSTTI